MVSIMYSICACGWDIRVPVLNIFINNSFPMSFMYDSEFADFKESELQREETWAANRNQCRPEMHLFGPTLKSFPNKG